MQDCSECRMPEGSRERRILTSPSWRYCVFSVMKIGSGEAVGYPARVRRTRTLRGRRIRSVDEPCRRASGKEENLRRAGRSFHGGGVVNSVALVRFSVWRAQMHHFELPFQSLRLRPFSSRLFHRPLRLTYNLRARPDQYQPTSTRGLLGSC